MCVCVVGLNMRFASMSACSTAVWDVFVLSSTCISQTPYIRTCCDVLHVYKNTVCPCVMYYMCTFTLYML